MAPEKIAAADFEALFLMRKGICMFPKKIKLDQIGATIAASFNGQQEIVCYLGSNAATPTASIEALTQSIKSQKPRLPFIKMVHLLLQGPVPYVEAG
ncbi:MAG: hypothetical protein PVG35_23345, partial [Desulfobacterales bacterium]